MNQRFSCHKLYFKLLGTPQIFSFGEEISITRRNVRALAYYLVCQPGLVNREELKLLFWPEHTESKASTALRETLSKLRGTLPDRDMLVSTSTHAYFRNEDVQSDVREFIENTQALESSLKNLSAATILPAHITSQIRDAINLWDGPSFLNTAKLPPTLNYTHWHDTFGQQLKLKQTHLLTTLIRHLVNSNNLTEAFHFLDLLSQDIHDDLDITFHYGLLNSLIDNQNYTIAKTYIEYLRPIALDHGYQLEETILKQIIEVVNNPTVRPTTESGQKWLQNLSFQLPMIGQDEIIKQIEKLPSSHQGVLLTGETGIGKSRVAYEAYQRVFYNYQFAHVEAFPSQANEPYSILRKLILQLMDRQSLQDLPNQLRRKLTPVFPEIVADIDIHKAPLKLPPVDALVELGRGIKSILANESSTQQLLIVIDDIQHCDYASFRILLDLVKDGFFRSDNFLMMTADLNLVSPGRMDRINSLQEAITFLPILPLPIDEAELLISQFLDRTVPANLIELLYKETKGNLHLMLSTIHNFQDSLINEDSINHLVMTNAISLPNWYISQRQQLSKDAADLLEYCAVLVSPIQHNLLEIATGWGPERIINALDELELYSFLAPMVKESVLSGYRFKHQILRTRTVEKITLAKMRKIHLALIRAFKKYFVAGIDQVAANIVDHCFGAGELLMALDYTLMAAEYANESYAPDVSNQLFVRMDKAIQENLHLFTDLHIRKFYGLWAQINLQFNELEAAKTHAEHLLQQGRNRGSKYLIGTSFLYLGIVESVLQLVPADSMQLFDQAILTLEQLPPSLELIHCKVEKAYYYSTFNQQNIARQLCQEILNTSNPDQSREDEYQRLLNRTKFSLAFLYSQSAELSMADELLTEILNTVNTGFDALTQLHYRNLHCWVKFYLGKTDTLEKELQDLLADADQLGNEIIVAEILANMCRVQHYFGNNDAALKTSDRGLEITRRYHQNHLITNMHIVRGFVYQSVGDIEASKLEFNQAMEESKSDNHQVSINGSAIHLAIIEGYSGNKEKGFRMAKAVIDTINHAGHRFLFLQSLFFYYSLCIFGDPERKYSQVSREDIDFYIDECQQKGLVLFEAYGETLISHLEFQRGSHNQGLRYILNAIRVSHTHNLKLFELSAFLNLALKKQLSEVEKNRVKVLVEELTKMNQDARLKDSIKEYLQFVAKTTQIG